MKILIKTVAGSHLFGTNTEKSDRDYKGVYLPTADQILMGQYSESVSKSTGNDDSKNGKDDIDVELYSLKKFMKMIGNGDTSALELLFTPEEYIIEKDPLWDIIVSQRDKLVSKRITAMTGYARQQANKYGIKGSRMGELSNCIASLKKIQATFDFQKPKLKHGWDLIMEELKGFDHIHFIELTPTSENAKPVAALDILGKKFDHHCTFIYVLELLKKVYKNYGNRAREAKKNNGIDWKALSHAYRVCTQGIELLSTGKITLPLPLINRSIVSGIKGGKLSYKEVEGILEMALDSLEAHNKSSTLKESVNKEFTDSLILEMHRVVVNETS